MEKIDVLHRKWIEGALERLRPLQSKVTGFLYKEPPFQAVSLEENLLFALLLFRKKQKETIVEGKKILARLLEFQKRDKAAADYGSFPVDLTEFPLCNDRTLPARVAFFLEVLIHDFGAVLGHELLAMISNAKEALLSNLKANWDKFPWPQVEGFYVRLLLPELPHQIPRDCLPDPTSLGRMLAAIDYFPECQEKENLLKQASLFWDEKRGRYCGPACCVYQQGLRPACSLFDCWMGLHSDVEPCCSWTRATSLEIALLRPGTLLRDWAKISCTFRSGCDHRSVGVRSSSIAGYGVVTSPNISTVSLIRNAQLILAQSLTPCLKKNAENESYSLFYLKEGTFAAVFKPPRAHILRGFSPLRFVTGGLSVAWNFPHGKLLSLIEEGNRFHGVVEREETQNPTLFEVFVERLPEVQFFVDGGRASFFDPVQGIEIHIGASILRIRLDPFAGESTGLLCMGNRSGQLMDVREEAFDWVVACDHIRGETPKQFSFCVEVEESTIPKEKTERQ